MEASLKKQYPWWQSTTIYQIYPRSFMDMNGDGIGDIQGIISKLDYLKRTGFETIWLSPFFQSPQRDFGYDISDYYRIAPEYGTLADIEQLIEEVHKRQMYVIFDMVMNHTSDQHHWFKGSKGDKEGHKKDWYIWHEGKSEGKRPPNNWRSLLLSRGWQFDEQRKQWYYASFLPFQPDLNYHNPEVKEAMFKVVRHWLQKGVDGFRLDIFNVIIKDSSFSNNPFNINPFPSYSNPISGFQKGAYTVNHPDNFELAKELRGVVNEFQDRERVLLGEVFGKHDTIRKFLGEKQEGLHLIFLFDMLKFRFSAHWFRKKIELYEKYYPAPFIPTIVFSNHDNRRSISRIKNNPEKAKLIALFQFTTRAVPVTYQGEEIGMTNAHIPLKQGLDPLAHKFRWVPQWVANLAPVTLNRDICRTPMQWSADKHAGFTISEKPWLPVNPDYTKINVASQNDKFESLLYTYRRLLHVRKRFKALQVGSITTIKHTPKSVLGYYRLHEEELIYIYINFSSKSIKIKFPRLASRLEFSTRSDNLLSHQQVFLKPLSGVIIRS